jgi:hypothetical protein
MESLPSMALKVGLPVRPKVVQLLIRAILMRRYGWVMRILGLPLD